MVKLALVTKKERWGLTWTGRLIILAALMILGSVYFRGIYSFLAQNKPLDSTVMVVEGFIPDYALAESMNIFNSGDYALMIITGKIRIKGSQLDQYENDGWYSAATLEKLGFDKDKIRVVSLEKDIRKDRTFASASAVKDWMSKNLPGTSSVNLVTIGCHARRSRLLFEKAFDGNMQVGIIAIQNQLYNPDRWWKSSSGFREVTEETITWLYALFFFRPG